MPDQLDVHRAARDGDIDAVLSYLQGGGDPNAVDRYDCEPIYYAVKHDNIEIAQLLVEAGGDVQRDSRLRGDPLGAAVWNLNRRMVDFVLASGANVSRLRHGQTPLDLIDDLRRFGSDRLADLEGIEQLLIRHGGKRGRDINSPSRPTSLTVPA